MPEQALIQQQVFKGIEVFGKGHLIKQCVYAAMTLPANINAGSQLLTIVGFLEKPAPVNFFWDQVMKGECSAASAQWTLAGTGTAAVVRRWC